LQGRTKKNNYYIGEPAGISMDAYKRALEREMIEKLKEHVKEWRANGGCGGDDHMYDLETWVHEIWGDE
jgi:hypothetical protein